MADQSAENMTNEPIENSEIQDSQTPENPVSENVELSSEEKFKIQLDEMNDKYIRLLAEFDNFKRRNAKEKIELINMAGADILKSMLSVLDDFDRAQKSIESAGDVNALKEGINLVHHKLKNTLTSHGLKEMESSSGQLFDTDLHEAVTNIPAPSEELKGKVVDELEKGYLLNDKVIRFAKVVVGS